MNFPSLDTLVSTVVIGAAEQGYPQLLDLALNGKSAELLQQLSNRIRQRLRSLTARSTSPAESYLLDALEKIEWARTVLRRTLHDKKS